MMPQRLAPIVLGLAGACHGEGADFTTSTSTSGIGPTSTGTTLEGSTSGVSGISSDATSTASTSAGSTSVVSSEVSTSEATSTTLALDVGSDKDVDGDGTPEGCKGKIDFLFVISRDHNMPVIQEQLPAIGLTRTGGSADRRLDPLPPLG